MVKTKNQLFFSPIVAVAFTVVFLVYSGIITIPNRKAFKSLLSNESIIMIEGIISSNPSKTSSGNYYSATLDTTFVQSLYASSEAKGHVQVLLPSEIVEALYPKKLYTDMHNTAGVHTPIVEQGMKGIFFGKFIKRDTSTSILKDMFIATNVQEDSWKSNLSKIRAKARIEFKRLLATWGDAGGLLLALLSGSREYTNSRLAEGFRLAGLSHILALSGMHLSLFAGLALKGGSVVSGKKLGTILSLIAVFGFVWFAGLSPSLFRALICTLISLLLHFCALPGVSGNSEIIYRFISPSFSSIRLIRILSSSFLIHISIFPQDAYTAAFMLSYAALIGISLAEYVIKPWLVCFIPNNISSALSASIGAQLCTAPIVVGLFGTLMPIGIISSVIVSPLILSYLVIGFFCIIITLAVPFLLYPFGAIIQYMYHYLESLVLWFAQFPPLEF